MTRRLLTIITVFTLLALSAVSISASTDQQGQHGQQGQGGQQDQEDQQGDSQDYGPFHSTSPDSGTCGNDWANDTFERHFTVSQGGARVKETFKKGTFVTIAGHSPGACQSGTDNGHTVAAGVKGKFEGSFEIVVTGGTFNPNAVCTVATCGTTAGFIATVFGAGATFDVPTFEFHYSAGKNGEWKNASANRGGNHGDIYTH